MFFNAWKRYAVLLIILLGFFLRLGLAQLEPEQRIIGDENAYTTLAHEFAQNPLAYANVFRPPLYPAFLAASGLLLGESRFVTAVLQALLAAVSISVMYALAQTLFRHTAAALLAAFLYAISFELVALTRLFYAETLFFTLSLIGFWLVFKWVRAPRAWPLLIAGLIIALAALTREVIGLFAVLCIPIWMLLVLAPQWKQGLVKSAFFGLGLAIIFVPWVVRNASIEGRFIFISTSGEHNFARDQARVETEVGIVPDYANLITSVEDGQTVVHYQPQIFKEIRDTPPQQRGAYAFQRGMAVIRHAPVLWFLAKLDSIRSFLTPTASDVRYVRLDNLSPEWEFWLDAMSVFFVIGVLLFSALGMVLARDNAPKLLILLYILFNLATFIITHYQPRYRLPLTLLLLPYAAYGMVRLVELVVFRRRNTRESRVSQTQVS